MDYSCRSADHSCPPHPGESRDLSPEKRGDAEARPTKTRKPIESMTIVTNTLEAPAG